MSRKAQHIDPEPDEGDQIILGWDWSRQITWPEYWPLIGQSCNKLINTTMATWLGWCGYKSWYGGCYLYIVSSVIIEEEEWLERISVPTDVTFKLYCQAQVQVQVRWGSGEDQVRVSFIDWFQMKFKDDFRKHISQLTAQSSTLDTWKSLQGHSSLTLMRVKLVPIIVSRYLTLQITTSAPNRWVTISCSHEQFLVVGRLVDNL